MVTDQESVEVGNKLIAEINEVGYDLRIEALNDLMECRVSITVNDLDKSISPSELVTLLKFNDISDTLDLEKLAEFCTEAASGHNPKDFLIASGTKPTAGEDGYFELFVDTGQEDISLEEDDKGRVDFKNIQTFTNVKPDQLIGTIYLPKLGTPGKTVTGQVIPAMLGKPARLIAGEGVEVRAKGTEVYATREGRVVFDNSVLSIAEEFVVSGDVDLKVGHINFNGFVDIKGDVLDDFNIKSTKGIHVSGAVGACILESNGPITVGSMSGLGLGKIIAKGDVTARYLNQVTVECWGNVFISNEIRNSVIKSTGIIGVTKGLITGGECIALEGIEAKLIGSKSGVKTNLTAGVFFPEADRLKFLRSRLKSIAYQLKKIAESLPALQKKPLESLRPALREAIELRINILTERQGSITTEQKELTADLAAFQAQEHATANPKINAMTSIKEGVVINLGETSEEVKMEINGPVSIIENQQSNGLRKLTYSPLKITAASLDETQEGASAANGS